MENKNGLSYCVEWSRMAVCIKDNNIIYIHSFDKRQPFDELLQHLEALQIPSDTELLKQVQEHFKQL